MVVGVTHVRNHMCQAVFTMLSLMLAIHDFMSTYLYVKIGRFLNLEEYCDDDSDSEFEFRFGGGGWNGWNEVDIGDWDDVVVSDSEDSGVELN